MADTGADAIPDLTETVELSIGGKRYGGWTQVSVTRAIDAMCGNFSLTLASKDDAAGATLTIAPDDRCELRIGGETVSER